MAILLTCLGISALIILHELGHYWTARACGMRVSRFSIGFGPTLVRYQSAHTLWQIGLVPLGGYVIIDGMGPAEQDAPETDQDPAPTAPIIGSPHVASAPQKDDDPSSYRNKPAWQRALVIAAGPAANWLVCAALLAALAVTTGTAQYDETQAVLGEMKASGPAAQAGLLAGDRVQRIDDTVVIDWPHLVDVVRAHPGQLARFEVVRGRTIEHIDVTPRDQGGVGVMEAMPQATFVTYPLGAGIIEGCRGAARLSGNQARALAGLFGAHGSAQLSGLPGIVKSVSHQAETSLARLFESLAYLSIGLCLLNLLPVPALDGGRLLFLGLEVLRRRPIDERVEGLVHTAGFLVLAAVMVFVSARDILRIF